MSIHLISFKEELNDLKKNKIYHLSTRGESYCLRYFNNEGNKKEIRQNTASYPSSYTELNRYIDNKIDINNSVDINNTEYWKNFLEIYSAVNTHTLISEKVLASVSKIAIENLSPDSKQNLIISTKLRKLYELMSGDTWASFLSELFNDALNSLESYNNLDQKFSKKEKPDSSKNTNLKPTENLQIFVSQKNEIKISDNIFFRYLGYEISPLRTQRSFFSSGLSGRKSGGGGIDLLCYNNETDNPVIMEYKSDSDHSLLYAVIQLLTYCSELCGGNQKERLKKHYNISQWVSEKYDLALVYDNTKKIENEIKDIISLTKNLLRHSKINSQVNSFLFIEVDITDKDNVLFKLNHNIKNGG